MKEDIYKIGIFEEYNFRFLITDCTNTFIETMNRNSLKHSSANLVGKSMLASFFLAFMVKEGVAVNLQLEGDGEIERVISYSDRIGRMKGHTKHRQILASPDDPSLGIGKGFFRVTRWGGVHKIHQSVTKLEKIPFEQNLINYINESDQLVSFVSLFVNHEDEISAKGMILQSLPFTDQKIIDKLMDGISSIELDTKNLFANDVDETLSILEKALSAEANILEVGKPEFYCGCSLQKIKSAIVSIGRDEAYSILEERGDIEMICEFCSEKYTLDAEEVRLLFI
jgi:molecular chaperone Hsp33